MDFKLKKISINQLLFLLLNLSYFEILRIYEYREFILFGFRVDELFAEIPLLWFSSKTYIFFALVFLLDFLFENLFFIKVFKLKRSYKLFIYFVSYISIISTVFNFITDENFIINRFLIVVFLFSLLRTFLLDELKISINIKTLSSIFILYILMNSFFILNSTKDTTRGFELVFSEYNFFINNRTELKKNYQIEYYATCCSSNKYAETGAKPGGFLNKFNEEIIVTSGNGEITSIDMKKINNNFLSRRKIKNNLYSLIDEEQFNNVDKISIRGVTIFNNEIYLSHINEPEKNCYNLRLLRGEIYKNEIIFKIFYAPNDCQFVESKISQSLHQSGGAIEVDNTNVYFAIGEFRNRPEAQNLESIFGKIIQINKTNQKVKTISMGHRNIQGMFKIDNEIYASEHGPKGGDEVNKIKIDKNLEVQNFGWPMSSYGEHYDGTFKEEAPLYDSHEDFGYIEPVFYFTPSIGISDIKKNSEYFIVSSMKGTTLYFIEEGVNGNILDTEAIDLEFRIRDFILIDDKILLYLEDLPGIAILYKK